MSNNKASFQLSDITSVTKVLNEEGKTEMAKALNRLQGRVVNADFLNSLSPLVCKRVEVLREIQCEHDELEAQFFEERAALEAKYQKLYEPLYTKRYEIVNGVVKVEDSATDTVKTGEESSEEKGVPDFWLTAMKNNDVLVDEISEHDVEALKFLKDIRFSKIDDPKGFKLDFFFDTNPYFNNSVLSKAYHVADEDEPILEKAIGTEIEWNTGKCLTEKIVKKKPKKGSKNAKPITKTEKCESFFNFFSPPEIPEDDEDMDEEAVEELQSSLETDYDIGLTIKEKIIPHAVSWFTGDAIDFPEAEDDDEGDDDEDEENDEDEYEDEDEDEDEEDHTKKTKKSGKAAAAGDGPEGERPTECKQQ